MPHVGSLADVLLSYPCPRCGTGQVKSGNWFMAIRQFRCSSCQSPVSMPYSEKIRLFNSHTQAMAAALHGEVQLEFGA
jgi:transposase-like protein